MNNQLEPPSTSPTLLRLLALPGADEAWILFLDRYGPLIDARCRQAGLQPSDIHDVRSSILARLVPAFRTFRHDPTRRFRGYLQRAVDNAIRTHWRTLRRHPDWLAAGCEPLDSLPESLAHLGAEIDVQIHSRVSALLHAIDRIRSEVGSQAWLAFELTAIEGLSGTDAAARLGKTPGAVYAAKCRVLSRLKAEFGLPLADLNPSPPEPRR
jgi:RNA polymerase sigma-70 factor (ECF subfamily)